MEFLIKTNISSSQISCWQQRHILYTHKKLHIFYTHFYVENDKIQYSVAKINVTNF